MSQSFVTITLEELSAGTVCKHPIEDQRGLLLLGRNASITTDVIRNLRDRDVAQLRIDARDVESICVDDATPIALSPERERLEGIAKSSPVRDLLIDRHDESLSAERTQELADSLIMAKAHFEVLRDQLSGNVILSTTGFFEIANNYAQSMVDDHDQTVGEVGAATRTCDLDERAIRMTVLGMAVATQMGMTGLQTLELGLTALLHDIGFYAMGRDFSKSIELMDEGELWEYRKHPLVSVSCVSEVPQITDGIQIAMEQVHEQFDGSGYPRGVKAHRIHNYAKILNVVDSYLQLTCPTNERRGIVPHDALGLMLHQASRGLFDPRVMRAFLYIETLFPLGSIVELTSGEVARVIRRPRKGFANPVLQNIEGHRIDLELGDSKVLRPVCDPDVDQIRLSPDVMETVRWHPSHPRMHVG
ncbi:MAG: HD domain-containing protein [Rubripirellula sp.]|nr:HD domain-containing protein [Rubripirellula sp.]